MISAALLFAAIITQQNDLYTTTADYATFSSNSTGIASRWIPYGTYTDGTGGTEYLRVTSNLIGVVASVFDGYEERSYLPGEYLPEDLGNMRYIYYPPPQRSGYFRDGGEYLQTTNNTRRILDFYGATSYIYYFKEGTNYSYNVGSGSDAIEARLAQTIESGGEFYNGGLASYYGGRKLDALVEESGDTAPPISTTWGTDVPFKVADIERWAQCWPAYSALTNDIHFFPAVSGLCHRCGRPFMDWTCPPYLVEVWGSDVNEAADDVVTNTLPIDLPFTMEDVLSADTGWKYEVPPVETGSYWTVSGPLGNFKLGVFYDYGWENRVFWDNWEAPYPTNYYVELSYNGYYGDYTLYFFDAPTSENVFQQTVRGDEDDDVIYFGSYHAQRTRLRADRDDYEHWRNDTTRLDWKRLGITCQLERQMEQTFYPRQEEDYLPFQRTTAARDHVYTGSIVVPMLDPEGGIIATTNFNTRSVTFSLSTQIVEVASTNFGWCFPTARLVGSHELGQLSGHTQAGQPVYADVDLIVDLFEREAARVSTAAGVAKGTLILEIGGSFAADNLNGFEWHWSNDWCEFYPEDAPDDWQDVSSYATGEEYFPATANFHSNITCNLVMSIGKRAITLQTDGDDMANTVTNLIHYPGTNVWARLWVAEQDRPALEVMLDAEGNEFDGYASAEDDSSMDWDDIKWATNRTRRAFRMSPVAAPRSTVSASDYNRWQQLNSLDQAVKSRFATIAGMGIDAAARNLVSFAAGEEQALKNQLQRQDLQLVVGLHPVHLGDLALVVIAGVSIDENGLPTGTSIYEARWYWHAESGDHEGDWNSEDVSADWHIGNYGFSMSSVNITNQVIDVKPVRVDGHQDQMVKTLWRFKNLRDPNL